MATSGAIQVVVVTPEKAVLDTRADFVVLPLYDGEVGVGKGHAAFVGQLGPGEFRFTSGGETQRYFIDGGFAQVRTDLVTVLTARALPAKSLSLAQGEEQVALAGAMPTATPLERANREKAMARATAMSRVAAKTTPA